MMAKEQILFQGVKTVQKSAMPHRISGVRKSRSRRVSGGSSRSARPEIARASLPGAESK